jgi:hypothetical protein
MRTANVITRKFGQLPPAHILRKNRGISMTNRTWVGGGNNQASNPSDWSPTGAPQPGDTLIISSGTMDVSGKALAGDTLDLSVTGNTANIYLKGDIAATAHVTEGSLHTFGGTIRFVGSNLFSSHATAVFNSNLTGSATLDIIGAGGMGSSVEVNGNVGSGLTFGFESQIPVTAMQIDHPKEFLGQLDLPPSPGLEFVAFMGLHVTSADLHDDLLSMYHGRSLVDAVRVVGGSDLQLQQNSQGVMLTEGYGEFAQPGGPGTAIPLHIS